MLVAVSSDVELAVTVGVELEDEVYVTGKA